MENTSELRQRHASPPNTDTSTRANESHSAQSNGWWVQTAQWLQESCYQLLAWTVWDRIMGGFQPGRMRAFEVLDIKTSDRVLLVGEGSGLDFQCLPSSINRNQLWAFDFSSEMVRQSKIKAKEFDIPEDHCFVGDAQSLKFTEEKFDKIFFPLSIASIPNPTLALKEAERVLSQYGKIVVFDKLLDDDTPITLARRILNIITQCTFADINRNLSGILIEVPEFKLIQYESLEGKLEGILARPLGQFYRIALIVRKEDYPDQAIPAKVLG
ncbi:MAG: class I SAM-dependent methyltransferase [Candidatus Obscuribacterales bacterium]